MAHADSHMRTETNERLHPHPLANEMASDRELAPDAEAARPRSDHPGLPRTERRISGAILVIGLMIMIAGLIIAAIFFRTTGLIVGTVIFVVLIGLLFLWPVLAAGSVKVVQDERAKGAQAPPSARR